MQDQILGTPGNDDLAIEPIAHIAGIHVTIGTHDGLSRLGILEIARHQARTLDQDVADLAICEILTVIAANHDLVAGDRPAANDEVAHPLRARLERLACRHSALRQFAVEAIDRIDFYWLGEVGKGDGER